MADQESVYVVNLTNHHCSKDFIMTEADVLILINFSAVDLRDQAREYFAEASRLEPQNYLPRLFGANVLTDPIASLMKAASLNTNFAKDTHFTWGDVRKTGPCD
jgi:hypothetical protein